ncbi:MAG: class I SAM-dependent methyltransferase [Desulfuromonadales bacterium]|nr:class I SAM-dependent methyltransferase [Desulfuromonadales bacterium]
MPRPANRLLDLTELQRPEFQQVIAEMEASTAREAISYLHPSKRWEYPWALEQARLAPGATVLDAGCGASIFPIYLAARGYRVCACDLGLPGRLDRLHGVEVGYVGADLGRLPLAAQTFDAVFCISVLEHLPRPAMPAALAELRRVLRPGGRLLLTTDFWRDAGEELWYCGEGEPFRVDWNIFDEGQLRQLVLAAPGWRLAGEIDLSVDWERTAAGMRRFHGYPYTSVGVVLERC